MSQRQGSGKLLGLPEQLWRRCTQRSVVGLVAKTTAGDLTPLPLMGLANHCTTTIAAVPAAAGAASCESMLQRITCCEHTVTTFDGLYACGIAGA